MYNSVGADFIYNTYKESITTIPYGERSCEVIDIISPTPVASEGEGQRSLLVYIHGGTWQEG